MRRKHMGNAQSRKVFTRGAVQIHPKNNQGQPMRGGTRL